MTLEDQANAAQLHYLEQKAFAERIEELAESRRRTKHEADAQAEKARAARRIAITLTLLHKNRQLVDPGLIERLERADET